MIDPALQQKAAAKFILFSRHKRPEADKLRIWYHSSFLLRSSCVGTQPCHPRETDLSKGLTHHQKA